MLRSVATMILLPAHLADDALWGCTATIPNAPRPHLISMEEFAAALGAMSFGRFQPTAIPSPNLSIL